MVVDTRHLTKKQKILAAVVAGALVIAVGSFFGYSHYKSTQAQELFVSEQDRVMHLLQDYDLQPSASVTTEQSLQSLSKNIGLLPDTRPKNENYKQLEALVYEAKNRLNTLAQIAKYSEELEQALLKKQLSAKLSNAKNATDISNNYKQLADELNKISAPGQLKIKHQALIDSANKLSELHKAAAAGLAANDEKAAEGNNEAIKVEVVKLNAFADDVYAISLDSQEKLAETAKKIEQLK